MTPTRHSITARFTVPLAAFGAPGSTTIEVEIAYSYQPRKLSDAPQVTVIAVVLLEDGGLNPTPSHVWQWSQDWLDGDGYLAACQRAEAQAA
jgi:hypothetical protein